MSKYEEFEKKLQLHHVDMKWELMTISKGCGAVVDSLIFEEKRKFGTEIIELIEEIARLG